MGRLSTHVPDVVAGAPERGAAVELWCPAPDGTADDAGPLVRIVTNADGHTDAPLLMGDALRAGGHELTFHVGDYFRARNTSGLTESPFLERVPIRFAVADPDGHYPAPLLVSPWSYSTHRGS